MAYKIILASGSPRRRELLEKAGVKFTVRVSDAEENYTAEDPAGIVRELAALKAGAVAEEIAAEGAADGGVIVLGADTVVAVDGRILGKPKDEAEAADMIRSFEGRSHEVHTGVSLIRLEPEDGTLHRAEEKVFSECTFVHVVPMTEEEILAYVAEGESLDKAGAYAIQGGFGKYIDRFEGDYENVIGLPVTRVLQELRSMERENR